MKHFNDMFIVGFSVFALLLSSCVKEPDNQNGPTPGADKFDFATTKILPVTVDYSLNDYSILVEIYDQVPVEEVSVTKEGQTFVSLVKKEGLNPIFRAITDKQGKFTDMMDIPTSLKTVYLYSEYAGIPRVVAAEITAAGINFDMKSLAPKALSSKADITHSYPKGMLVLSDWDAKGRPASLLPERMVHPAGLMNDISSIFRWVGVNVASPLLPYLDQGMQTNINVTDKTPLKLVFADETASMVNAVGYYHYPTNTPPASVADLKVIIALPNSSYPQTIGIAGDGALSSGDQLQLQYWNSETQAFETDFPANTTIGFVMMSSSFKSKNASVEVFRNYYSNSEFNTTEDAGANQHCVVFKDEQNHIIYGFEDMPRKGSVTQTYPGGDFRDAVFYIQAGNSAAINIDKIPQLPESSNPGPSPSDNFIIRTGSIAFEDNWPYEGDYDMNDVVLDYECTLYRNGENKVVKTKDVFTVRNNGGKYTNGFGYQMNIAKTQVSSVEISPAPSASSIFKTDSKGMELGQSLVTIMLFDNISLVKGQIFEITTNFVSNQPTSKLIPPYNPFIVIRTDQGRGQEVHLVNQPPTDLANKDLFGKGMDVSDPAKGLYYISKNQQYPFALKIPETGFDCPREMNRIDNEYPKFNTWVNSQGNEAQDWYKHKK